MTHRTAGPSETAGTDGTPAIGTMVATARRQDKRRYIWISLFGVVAVLLLGPAGRYLLPPRIDRSKILETRRASPTEIGVPLYPGATEADEVLGGQDLLRKAAQKDRLLRGWVPERYFQFEVPWEASAKVLPFYTDHLKQAGWRVISVQPPLGDVRQEAVLFARGQGEAAKAVSISVARLAKFHECQVGLVSYRATGLRTAGH